MPPPAAASLSPPEKVGHDPILERLAVTGTFDVDWPTLQKHLHTALVAALPLFLAKGQPQSQAGRISIQPARSPTITRQGGPGVGESLLLSPSARPVGEGWSHESAEGSGSRLSPGGLEGSASPESALRPSTPGGLVIAPFPPLDPNARRRSMSAPGGNMSAPGGSPKINGGGVGGRGGNPYDEEWDEEILIGGRKLPGWLDEEEGRRDVDKVATKLDELPFAPFTVQRLAELLIAPTAMHSTIGKFLRAVDKTLNVTTPYAPPSYTYVPPSALPITLSPGSPHSSMSAESDVDSTVPPGSMTPMFSPIPFLAIRPDMEMLGEGRTDEALMSPLLLGESSRMGGAGSVFASQQQQQPQQQQHQQQQQQQQQQRPEQAAGRRSPTPEPEDDAEPTATEATSNGASDPPAASSSEAEAEVTDPGHQPYLGRVDELDSGPITANGHSADKDKDEHDDGPRGVGEAGNMTPHGMSDRPVPLSSTTVITESEREIAPVPRTRSQSTSIATEEEEEAKEEKIEAETA
ncbi:Serine/threonine-protein phosphatase 4 regulatory subunit 2 [Vanrija pseudolonga]|uniref:Serine/threonine-protein phosphatase 4 regulatory subunit 2 n=1 Tax=Vanrija pseudolonga TaxID=143232 RepID=A0AAF0Y7J8_9TREE|nr:Serine/threonine-protein phosphatase 4 regulatory subunit 2 [Vanrija pseudolonga]